MDEVLEVINRALKDRGLSDAAASNLAVGNPSLIKNMRSDKKQEKRYSYQSLAKLAEVLGLELYFGPRRKGLTALIEDERPLPFPPSLTRALGLPEDADEDAVTEKIEAMQAEFDLLRRPSDIKEIERAMERAISRQLSALAQPSASNDNRVDIPLRKVDASAGFGAAVLGEEIERFLAFERSWLARMGLSADNCGLIRVRGDSMEPELRDGDVILVDFAVADLRDGAIYVALLDDDLLVKRVRKSGDGIDLTSDNPTYGSVSLRDDTTVIGRVVWSARSHSLDPLPRKTARSGKRRK